MCKWRDSLICPNSHHLPSDSRSFEWRIRYLWIASGRLVFARTASFCLLAIFLPWRLRFYLVFLYSVCSLHSTHYGVSQKSLKMLSQSQRQSRGGQQESRLKEVLRDIFQRSQTQRNTQKCVSEFAAMFIKKASWTFLFNLMPFSHTYIAV